MRPWIQTYDVKISYSVIELPPKTFISEKFRIFAPFGEKDLPMGVWRATYSLFDNVVTDYIKQWISGPFSLPNIHWSCHNSTRELKVIHRIFCGVSCNVNRLIYTSIYISFSRPVWRRVTSDNLLNHVTVPYRTSPDKAQHLAVKMCPSVMTKTKNNVRCHNFAGFFHFCIFFCFLFLDII